MAEYEHIPEDYRMTKLGPLPEEWQVVRLEEMADVKQGRTPRREDYDDAKGTRIIKVKDFTDGNKVHLLAKGERSFVRSNTRAFVFAQSFDALLLNSGHSSTVVGQKIGLVPEELDTIPYVGELTAIRAHRNITDSFFLFANFQLSDQRRRITGLVKGGHLYSTSLRSLPVPLPPLPEQRAIAHVLRTVQEAREKTEAVIEAAKALKKSMMQYLFTYGPVPIDEAEQVPLKETEVGMMPEGWGISRFSEIVEIVKGQIDPREEPYNKMLHIGPENILPETGQIVGMRTAEDIGLISGQFYFTSENVIYSKIRPYLKKVAFPKIEGTCSADMYPLKPKDDRLSPEFLFHYLLSNQFSNDAISFQDRTGIPKINRQQLGLINLPLPKLIIQQKIANSLASIDKKIAAEESRKAALDQLFQTLLHDLLTAKIRVNHISVPVADT